MVHQRWSSCSQHLPLPDMFYCSTLHIPELYLNSTWTLHIPLLELYLTSRQINIFLYLSIYSGSATLSPASTLPLHLCTLHSSISFTSILALSHLSLNSARPLQPPVAPSPWQVGTWVQNWGWNIWEEKSKEDHLIVKVHSAKKEIQWGYDWVGHDETSDMGEIEEAV